MSAWPLLSAVIFTPLAGAGLVLAVRGSEAEIARNARAVALLVSMANLMFVLLVLATFEADAPGFQFVEQYDWISPGIRWHVGVDGLSLLFVVLTAALMPICILAAGATAVPRARAWMAAFLALETFMIGVFCALDMVVFYLFFEAGLIPMFLIIGIWGGPRRVYAAFKFFLYTFLGSVLFLIAIMAIYREAGTTDVPTLLAHDFPVQTQTWLWFAFLAAFAVKLPMWPVHTWLPDAHVEAPTAGSVVLAAILLKMGGYGLMRFSLPMFPVASHDFAPLIYILSATAILYASLVALAQEDIKKLIAYASVAHMGFVTMGLFTATVEGIQGAIFQMLSHGWISAALFLSVGVLYDRAHTRDIAAFGGLARIMPRFAVVLMVFTLANLGLPGTSGFVGEFLTIVAAFRVEAWVAVLAAIGMILAAAYGLWLYRRLMFGEPARGALAALPDLTRRETATLAPLVLAAIVFGVWPTPILRTTAPAVERLVSGYQAALARHGRAPQTHAVIPAVAPAVSRARESAP